MPDVTLRIKSDASSATSSIQGVVGAEEKLEKSASKAGKALEQSEKATRRIAQEAARATKATNSQEQAVSKLSREELRNLKQKYEYEKITRKITAEKIKEENAIRRSTVALMREQEALKKAAAQARLAQTKASMTGAAKGGTGGGMMGGLGGVMGSAAAIKGALLALPAMLGVGLAKIIVEAQDTYGKGVEERSKTSNEVYRDMRMVGMSQQEIEAAMTKGAVMGSGHEDVGKIYTGAAQLSGGNANLREQIADEALHLNELGISPEQAIDVLAKGVAKGMDPEKMGSMFLQAQQHSTLTPEEMAKILSRSENENVQETMGIAAALSRSGMDGRKVATGVETIEGVLSGEKKINQLSDNEKDVWQRYQANIGIANEVKNMPIQEGVSRRMEEQLQAENRAYANMKEKEAVTTVAQNQEYVGEVHGITNYGGEQTEKRKYAEQYKQSHLFQMTGMGLDAEGNLSGVGKMAFMLPKEMGGGGGMGEMPGWLSFLGKAVGAVTGVGTATEAALGGGYNVPAEEAHAAAKATAIGASGGGEVLQILRQTMQIQQGIFEELRRPQGAVPLTERGL